MPVLKEKPVDLKALNTAEVNPRILVVMAACVLILAASKSGFVYAPLRRNTQAKAILTNLPKLLAQLGSSRSAILHELTKAMRSGAKTYLKSAARELAGLFAEE